MVDFRRIDSLRVRAALGNLENIKAHGNAEACGVMVIGNVIGELCDEVDALRVMAARVKELEAALAPFADIADLIDSETEGVAQTDDTELYLNDYLLARWSVSTFTSARAALAQGEKP